MAELSVLDPWLQLDRVSSRALLEASEQRRDEGWVAFTDLWPTRQKRVTRYTKLVPPQLPIRHTPRKLTKIRHVKPTPVLEETANCYGLPALPTLSPITPQRHRPHQSSEDRLQNSPPVLHMVRLQPSTRTPGRPRLPMSFASSPVRIRRRSVLRSSGEKQKNSSDSGVGVLMGHRMKGSIGEIGI